MMIPEQRALRFAAATTLILPGLFGVVSAHAPLSGAMGTVLDAVYWPLDQAQGLMAEETRLLTAILGGIITGWGVMIWQLAGAPLARDGALVRPIIRNAIVTWFVLDSTGSLLAGAPLNVAANLVFLAMFLVPLARVAQPVSA
jgi:hypothetical protein